MAEAQAAFERACRKYGWGPAPLAAAAAATVPGLAAHDGRLDLLPQLPQHWDCLDALLAGQPVFVELLENQASWVDRHARVSLVGGPHTMSSQHRLLCRQPGLRTCEPPSPANPCCAPDGGGAAKGGGASGAAIPSAACRQRASGVRAAGAALGGVAALLQVKWSEGLERVAQACVAPLVALAARMPEVAVCTATAAGSTGPAAAFSARPGTIVLHRCRDLRRRRELVQLESGQPESRLFHGSSKVGAADLSRLQHWRRAPGCGMSEALPSCWDCIVVNQAAPPGPLAPSRRRWRSSATAAL